MKYFLLSFFLFNAIDFCYAQNHDSFNSNTNIYIVRHAEKLKGTDPLLTDEGNERAGDLMRALKNEHISRVYVSEFKRTQHTADSLHILLNIDTAIYAADTSCYNLFDAITKNKDWHKTILIISHSNIIPLLIYKLGITDFPQQNIPDTEFDNLYKLTLKNKEPFLQQIKYGKHSSASEKMQ